MGNKRKQWKYYDKVNDIMGNRPSVTPPVTRLCMSINILYRDDNGGEEDSKDVSGKETKCTGNVSEKSVNGNGKKRKHIMTEVMEYIMMKAMKTVTDGLKESEKMFVEFEEKHMKFEERMNQKDQEHQMEVMKLLVSRLTPPNPAQYPLYQPYSSQPGYCNPIDGL